MNVYSYKNLKVTEAWFLNDALWADRICLREIHHSETNGPWHFADAQHTFCYSVLDIVSLQDQIEGNILIFWVHFYRTPEKSLINICIDFPFVE